MSLNVFIAICILGLDVLIYFLYQWVLGEKSRARLQREISRQRALAAQGAGAHAGATPARGAAAQPVITMARKGPAAPSLDGGSNRYSEEFVYRRLAASFAHSKPRG